MTRATVEERELGGVPWLIVRGPRLDALRSLGAYAAERIHSVVRETGVLEPLYAKVSREVGAHNLFVVRQKTKDECPQAWAELEMLAEGSGAAFDDLLLLNLRGDLGVEDGTGCSAMAYGKNGSAFIAHNEDGAFGLHGLCVWLTLALDDLSAVTLWWYPGFVPANCFTATETSVVWAIDHVTIAKPEARPGRHFVTRELQPAKDLEQAIRYLREHPSAGGFIYTMGSIGDTGPVVVETAAESFDRFDVAGSFCWRTNHLLGLPDGLDRPSDDSRTRERALASTTFPKVPTAEWFMTRMTKPSYPEGVYKNPIDGNSSATLVTTVVDLVNGFALLKPRDKDAVSVPFGELFPA